MWTIKIALLAAGFAVTGFGAHSATFSTQCIAAVEVAGAQSPSAVAGTPADGECAVQE